MMEKKMMEKNTDVGAAASDERSLVAKLILM